MSQQSDTECEENGDRPTWRPPSRMPETYELDVTPESDVFEPVPSSRHSTPSRPAAFVTYK